MAHILLVRVEVVAPRRQMLVEAAALRRLEEAAEGELHRQREVGEALLRTLAEAAVEVGRPSPQPALRRHRSFFLLCV